ncbi:MAG: replication protein A [Sphingobium sp.]
MTGRSIDDILAGTAKKVRRTFQPVRRNSYHAGEREHRHWRPINKREIGARLKAAEHFDRSHKEAGKHNGPLGHIGFEVLRGLYRMVDFKTGRLDPSIATIMSRIKRSRAAVVRALARLKAHGFLNWIRRTEPTDNEGQRPQVRQITNACWFGLPKRAADWVKRVMGAAPPPDDDVTRRAAEAAELEEMIEFLPMRERMAARVNDPHLAEILARMGEGIEGLSASSPRGQNPA